MTVLILAKAFGCSVIVTSSSDSKLEIAKRYGADQTINYKTTQKWGEEALKLTRGEGVDLVIENGGAGTIEQSFKSIKMGGGIAVIGFLAKPDGPLPDLTAMALDKGAIVRGITVGSKQYLEELVTFASARTLRIPIDKNFKLADAMKAYEYLQEGSHVGKVCIEL
jgi:NADPH:quinone reductase-like Zn-dependent oxidoreductase